MKNDVIKEIKDRGEKPECGDEWYQSQRRNHLRKKVEAGVSVEGEVEIQFRIGEEVEGGNQQQRQLNDHIVLGSVLHLNRRAILKMICYVVINHFTQNKVLSDPDQK